MVTATGSTRKYQIFISSTFEDLREQREQVVRAVLEMGHIPVGMEMFSAADDQQWTIIQRHIDDADYYVVLVAHRYGSMDGDRSYTEKEYDYACSCGVPVLGFVIEAAAPWNPERIDRDPVKSEALHRFKTKVMKKPVSFWKTAADLYGSVSVALMKQMTATPRTGWIRADQAAGPEVLSELARLSTENASLRARLASTSELRSAPMVSIAGKVSWADNWMMGSGRWSPVESGPKSGQPNSGVNATLQLSNSGTLATALTTLSLTILFKDGTAISSASCFAIGGWPLAVPERFGKDYSITFFLPGARTPRADAVEALRILATDIDGVVHPFDFPATTITER